MKREEANYMQDNDVKQVERIKVNELDIIVNMVSGKPYYEIKYKKIEEDYYHIGYSSYNLDFVLEWKNECFELVRERKSVAGWIPVSERLPEERDSIFKKFKGTSKWNPMMFEKTSGYVIATVEYMDRTRLTTRAHTADGIWKADNSLMSGKVVAWMPLPEPYRESEV